MCDFSNQVVLSQVTLVGNWEGLRQLRRTLRKERRLDTNPRQQIPPLCTSDPWQVPSTTSAILPEDPNSRPLEECQRRVQVCRGLIYADLFHER